MNSEDLTLPLNEPAPDAPSTQPLLKEMMADIRELKANSVTKTEFAYLVSVVERLEKAIDRIEQRLDGIEREQKLARFGMIELSDRQLRQGERLTMLERDFDAAQKVAA